MKIETERDKERAIAQIRLLDLSKGSYNQKLTKYRHGRSLSQNAYFHGVIVPIWADNQGLFEFEAKGELKEKFLSYEKKGRTFVRPTSDLDTKEFENFCSKCRMFASIEGCFIPLPNECTDELMEEIEKIKTRI